MKELKIIGPAATFQEKEIARKVHKDTSTTGQRIADSVASIVGSWKFIITQSVFITVWVTLNATLPQAWDPYPFILLNLALSFQAAYTGPVVMMSQNRQAEKDRKMAEHDYECDLRAEDQLKVLFAHLVHQDQLIAQIFREIGKNREIQQSLSAKFDEVLVARTVTRGK